jgi:teichuronic acid exporter
MTRQVTCAACIRVLLPTLECFEESSQPEHDFVTDRLKSKALRAVSWTFLEAVGLRGTQFVVQVILARLLLPEQFGLIAMLAVFMAVAESLLDSGFGTALIQKRDATQVDKCSIFYFNIVVGLVIAALLCLAAPWIALFYDQPGLTPLARVMSLMVVINAFGLIQNTVLTKELNFRVMTKASLTASVLSGGIGISLAAFGFGVWSLVAQQVSYALLRTVSLWLANTWRPAAVFSFASLRQMFGFGSRVMASGLLNTFFGNIYLLTIGKLFSASDLGFFSRAKRFQELPTHTLSWTIGRVTFPVFASIQDDPARLRRGLKSVLTSLAFLNFPLMIGILATARPLVLAMLTEKWAPSIPYLRLLCLEGLLFPMNWFNMNVLYAIGRSDLCLRLEVVKKVLIVVSIAITWRWGIEAMIGGQVVVSLISYCLNSHYNGVLIGYPIKRQLLDLLPYAVAPALMGMGVYLIGHAPVRSNWLRLSIQVFAGVVLYIGICRLLRLPRFLDVWRMGEAKMSSLGPGPGTV